ncbi:MAG: hypothetical protein ACI4N3_01060 [Alphaproteobacteria bacterium]
MDKIQFLEYAKLNGKKQAWIGKFPQFDMDILDLERCTNFRLASKFHGIYDTVWLYEKQLQEYHTLSWKIILDESIRLLKQEGHIIIRMSETSKLTIPMLKNFFGRNININVSIDVEYRENNFYIIVFKIKRLNFEIYQDKSWSFAMLTGGKKDDVVIKFLESIRKYEPQKSQIIISGPKKEIYDKYDVEYLDLSKYRDNEYAEISKKKNDIAKMATGANLLIVHDRYYLSDNFFSDFEKYGYDFDFLAIKQKTDTDKILPYYCATYEPKYAWTSPIDCQNFNILPNTCYVNGGCLVFKTKTLNKIYFNDLIFWNQMEDVEITQEFIAKSIIPRVNFITIIKVVDDGSERMSANYKFDIIKGDKIFNHSFQLINKKSLYGINNKKASLIFFKLKLKHKFPFIYIKLKFRKRK